MMERYDQTDGLTVTDYLARDKPQQLFTEPNHRRGGENEGETVYSTIAARLLMISPSTSRFTSAPYKKTSQLG